MPCSQCDGIERMFDRKKAQSQLKKFRRKGPDRTTRMLLDQVCVALQDHRAEPPQARLLLDIGAGVGALHHHLLDHGIQRAVHVDASSSYLAAAREEAERLGHSARVDFKRGDFTVVADELGPADVVTLDRVICCYHDMPGLVSRSVAKARRLYGAVYPRDAWWTRLSFRLGNALLRVKRSPFRIYLHRPADIDTLLDAAGLRRRSLERTLMWEVAVYERREAAA